MHGEWNIIEKFIYVLLKPCRCDNIWVCGLRNVLSSIAFIGNRHELSVYFMTWRKNQNAKWSFCSLTFAFYSQPLLRLWAIVALTAVMCILPSFFRVAIFWVGIEVICEVSEILLGKFFWYAGTSNSSILSHSNQEGIIVPCGVLSYQRTLELDFGGEIAIGFCHHDAKINLLP